MNDDAAVSLAELLCALSFATDIGLSQPLEHGLRSAYIGLALADASGLPADDREAVFYGALLKDAGCTACAPLIETFFSGHGLDPGGELMLMNPDSMRESMAWLWQHATQDSHLPQRVAHLFSFFMECRPAMRETTITHCEIGELMARRFGLPEHVQRAVRYGQERWDGKGMAFQMRGPDTPVAARVVHIAQVVEVARTFGGRAAAQAIASQRRGTEFDPELVGVFLDLGERESFWSVLEQESLQETVLGMRPEAAYDRLTAEQIDDACEGLADFIDVKARTTWNHSRVVAEAAAGIGAALHLGRAQRTTLRRSGLLHDLGKAAVPASVLHKGRTLSPSERERFRLHPYYTERILAPVPLFREVAALAASGHESLDGGGYHRGLRGEQIPLEGRVLAVADEFAVRARAVQGTEEAPDIERVLVELRPLVGSQLDGDCFAALEASVSGTTLRRTTTTRRQPGVDLSEREREVLSHVADGLSNREIARRLAISEKTVEHHLEHIFNKLGVSSRTAAAVAAVQQGALH